MQRKSQSVHTKKAITRKQVTTFFHISVLFNHPAYNQHLCRIQSSNRQAVAG